MSRVLRSHPRNPDGIRLVVFGLVRRLSPFHKLLLSSNTLCREESLPLTCGEATNSEDWWCKFLLVLDLGGWGSNVPWEISMFGEAWSMFSCPVLVQSSGRLEKCGLVFTCAEPWEDVRQAWKLSIRSQSCSNVITSSCPVTCCFFFFYVYRKTQRSERHAKDPWSHAKQEQTHHCTEGKAAQRSLATFKKKINK